jgi:hypothetical protein
MTEALRNQRYLAYGFGVAFIVVLLVIALFVPSPSPFQFFVLKVVLALAAAGVAAMIPGSIEFKIPMYGRALGALAVFAIVYFANPASLVTQPVDPEFIAVSTDQDLPMSAIVDAVVRQKNVTVHFDRSCDENIKNTLIDKGNYQGTGIQQFLDNVRLRAKGQLPAFHVTSKGDRYEIVCP